MGVGNDALFGEGGADTLSGCDGRDSFIFLDLSFPIPQAADVIRDFDVGADTIDLSHIHANVTMDDVQLFDFIGSKDFSGKAGELNDQIVGGVALLSGDIDGDGHAEFQVVLANRAALTVNDLILSCDL